MGTRFAAYTLKLASLHEYHQRLLHGCQPIPSGFEMANTLKYFSQIFLSLLREVPESPFEMIRFQKLDGERLSLYPNLDYRQLYNALTQLVDVTSMIHVGLQVFGRAFLQCLTCLMPFLDHDLIEGLPYLAASTITVFHPDQHQDVLNYLCYYIIPFIIVRKREDGCVNLSHHSLSAVIMMIFQYSCTTAHHCQLLECLMAYKREVVHDLLCVIAYGTTSARASAAKLLFYYWPTFNSNLFDRRTVLMKLEDTFIPFTCQRDACPNVGNAEATKVCYDHRISTKFSVDSPPPLYLCIECANEIHREHPNQMFYDVIHPMLQLSQHCENKNCRSIEKSTVSICFDAECVSYNGNHPIRYCHQCHNIRHNNRRGEDHVFHTMLPCLSLMDFQSKTYTIEAIISLLKEAELIIVPNNAEFEELNSLKPNIRYGRGSVNISLTAGMNITSLEDRQLLGRYGICLLIGLCMPKEEADSEIFGRLLSMLFHWFHTTSYSFGGTKKSLVHLIFSVGQAESTLEKLKTDHVCKWISEITKIRYNTFLSCLLPHPADYVRVGGHWEALASRTSHLKDGLSRLFCLVPYEVITTDIWEYVMPFWLEAIVNDVPGYELEGLKTILCKILDPDMSPLGFGSNKMYHFISKRFMSTNTLVQEQALKWLQTLTMMQITIPLRQLFAMFSKSILVLKSKYSTLSNDHVNDSSDLQRDNDFIHSVIENNSDKSTPVSDDIILSTKGFKFDSNIDKKLSCSILMLDILLKQMELQNIQKHTGINTSIYKNVCYLIKSTLAAEWECDHICDFNNECLYCESRVIWHQLCYQLLKYLVPENPVYVADILSSDNSDDYTTSNSAEVSKKFELKPDVMNIPVPELHSVGGVLVHMPHFFEQIMTSTIESVSEELNSSTKGSAEDKGIFQRKTSSDNLPYRITKDSPLHLGDLDDPIKTEYFPSENNMPQGYDILKISFNDLPEPLQYIYKLLKEVWMVCNPDVLYYILQCLSTLCLHGDILTIASREENIFFTWCQENLIIENLWIKLTAEHSHIAQVTVPILLHSITLPHGADIFWNLIDKDFNHEDWRTRFVAVDRITTVARFVKSTPLENERNLQSSLAYIFCCLIKFMDDRNIYVAQRATLNLGTIHDSAIHILVLCLETQFDTVMVDRPVILQSLLQLHNCLSDRKLLNWDFFLKRFDALYLEAQISLREIEVVNCVQDIQSTDVNTESFILKVTRARDAVNYLHENHNGRRTLNDSLINRYFNRNLHPRTTALLSNTRDFYLDKITEIGQNGLLSTLKNIIYQFEVIDTETVHLLTHLFLQFLSRHEQTSALEEKYLSTVQERVLHHVFLLLGFDDIERIFHSPPHLFRLSPIFNVFMINLPQVLDQNLTMGRIILPSVLAILEHCSSPIQILPSLHHQSWIIDLWGLEPHIRRSWLMSFLILLYKSQYELQQGCDRLLYLVQIIINTLNRHYHHCGQFPITMLMPSRSSVLRGVSIHKSETNHSTPIQIRTENMNSPVYTPKSTLRHNLNFSNNRILKKSDQEECEWPCQYYDTFSSYSLNPEVTEAELTAIPESPKLRDTINNSNNDTNEDMQAHKSNSKWTLTELQYESSESYSANRKDVDKSLPSAEMQYNISKRGDNYISNYNQYHQNRNFLSSPQPSRTSVISYSDNSSSATISSISSPNANSRENLNIAPDNQKIEFGKQAQVIYTPTFERLLPIGTTVAKSKEPNLATDSVQLHGSTQLKFPVPERLLPIGYRQVDISDLADRVKQVLDHVAASNSILSDAKLSINTNNITFIPEIKTYVANSNTTQNENLSSRKLTKQVALDYPCKSNKSDGFQFPFAALENKIKLSKQFSRSDERTQVGKRELDLLSGFTNYGDGWSTGNLEMQLALFAEKVYHADYCSKYSAFQIAENNIFERCNECGITKQEYSDEELGLCIITLGTFINKEPLLAAPILPEIFSAVSKASIGAMYLWQSEANVYLPGGVRSVAHQFLRCVLHQLLPNGVFTQIFQTNINEHTRVSLFKSITHALTDFSELNPISPLQLLLETLNGRKTLRDEHLSIILCNMATYLDCLPAETNVGACTTSWNGLIIQCESFFRRLVLLTSSIAETVPILDIMIKILKFPSIQQSKGLLESFSKVLNCSLRKTNVAFNALIDLCHLSIRAFTRDRDKYLLIRTIMFELMQAIKCKIQMSDYNWALLLQVALQDIGGKMFSIPMTNNTSNECTTNNITNATESLRNQISDIIDFLVDLHSISKLKICNQNILSSLNSDTIGGIIKSALSQYIALEISKGNNREMRSILRYLPWITNMASTYQQGSRESGDYISPIRLLSWILLGSITHVWVHSRYNLLTHGLTTIFVNPVPQETSCYVVDHVKLIFSAISDQYKLSELSPLLLGFAFNLCELWTIYLEDIFNNNSTIYEIHNCTMDILFEFWCKITPCILHLSTAKSLQNMTKQIFLTVVRNLVQCKSTALKKLLPVWNMILPSIDLKLSHYWRTRAQCYLNNQYNQMSWYCSTISHRNCSDISYQMVGRLQFKMSQIELLSFTWNSAYII